MESTQSTSSAADRAPTPVSRAGVVWAKPEFGLLYDEHSRMVYYLALRLLGDPTQAEDATHDVFLKAFRKIERFRGDSQVRTWLYRITINHCQNLQRAWHSRHMVNNVEEELWEHTPGLAESPLRILETKELGQRIQATLEGIPDEYRLLLLLVADERLSYEEIAELTSQSIDAVRGKIHRARKAFASLYKSKDR